MSNNGGMGLAFAIGDDILSGTPTYTTIAALEDMDAAEFLAIMTENTGHDATGGYKTQIPSGKKEISDIKLILAFDSDAATHSDSAGGVLSEFQAGTAKAYRITLPGSGEITWEFDAYISGFKFTAGQTDHNKAEVTVSPTGQPTLTNPA